MQQGFEGRFRDSRVISHKAYRLNISITFLIWAVVLFSAVFVFEFSTFLKRDDFHGLAQIATDLSAISLALLALVCQFQTNSNKYLKLTLSALSLLFILTTLLSVLVLSTTRVTDDITPFEQKIKIIVLIWVFLGIGFTGLLSISISLLVSTEVERWKFLRKIEIYLVNTRLSVPIIRVTGFVIDSSIFTVPFFVIIIWASPSNLASVTLVLLIGGLANVIALSIVLTIETLRKSKDSENKYNPVILEILNEIHTTRCEHPDKYEPYDLVKIETLMTSLATRGILTNKDHVYSAVRELGQANSIFENFDGCYIFPTKEEIDKAVDLMASVNVAISGYVSNNTKLWRYNDLECTFLTRFLSEKMYYPLPIIENYVFRRAFSCLEENCDFSLIGNVSDTDYNIKFYAKRQELDQLWKEILENDLIELDVDTPLESTILFRNLADQWVSIPTNLYELENECIELFIYGIKQLFGVEIVTSE